MAASLFALLDDIAYIMDDVATLSKVGASKTMGVVGDDIAVSANTVVGSLADRELPIVWKIMKGSFLNKLIIVPMVMLLSTLLPSVMTYVMILGGLYLCLEGAEKVIEHFTRKKETGPKIDGHVIHSLDVDHKLLEDEKVQAAIRTDFVLSLEIVVISLASITEASLLSKTLTLSFIAIGFTIFVYSLVGFIVKLDDMGYAMTKMKSASVQSFGRVVLNSAPMMMRGLTILGTLAMFSVGGEIVMHEFHQVKELLEPITNSVPNFYLGFTVIFGLLLGLMVVPVAHLAHKLIKKKQV